MSNCWQEWPCCPPPYFRPGRKARLFNYYFYSHCFYGCARIQEPQSDTLHGESCSGRAPWCWPSPSLKRCIRVGAGRAPAPVCLLCTLQQLGGKPQVCRWPPAQICKSKVDLVLTLLSLPSLVLTPLQLLTPPSPPPSTLPQLIKCDRVIAYSGTLQCLCLCRPSASMIPILPLLRG